MLYPHVEADQIFFFDPGNGVCATEILQLSASEPAPVALDCFPNSAFVGEGAPGVSYGVDGVTVLDVAAGFSVIGDGDPNGYDATRYSAWGESVWSGLLCWACSKFWSK